MSVRGRVAPRRVRAIGTLLAYLALTKPRVIELLLVTAIPAMLLAHRGTVNPLLILDTLIGGILAAGGANTLNCVADADIDKLMKRTARRPLAREAVPTRNALVLWMLLSVGSFFWLWWTTNLLSGLLAVATIALNTTRIAFMAQSQSLYAYWHDGSGKTIVSLTMLAVMLGVDGEAPASRLGARGSLKRPWLISA